MNKYVVVISIFVMSILAACVTQKNSSGDLFAKENLVAWCIIPFDAKERNPEERALMLKELGISRLAYDYRDRHIPSFRKEIEVLKQHQIELSAVWLWVDPENPLSEATIKILETVEETGTSTEFWVGMPDGAFEGLSDAESLDKAVKAMKAVQESIEKTESNLALYNHGGWYGEPGNQVRIIEALGSGKVKIVYNFHHGHHQVSRFEELLDLMLPHLSCININGMNMEGPKIIPLGEGEHELEMLRIIRASGYEGPIGILGHTEGEDIREVLKRNLHGLDNLRSEL
ncbi:MAG: TIM barrel protein [Bacteroidota bacterium]